MKLAPAIEEFIQYKQALGNPYITPSNILKAFLRKTGNVEFDELTAQHAEAFLPINGSTVTSTWFHRYSALRLVSSAYANQPWLHATSNPSHLNP